MEIKDCVYGNCEIIEPVLVDLIGSPTLLRLQKINQYGVPDKYFHLKNYSRYEHSLGVMLLLKRLGANLEEQIAGLLHDVSHLAFSHVADWVFSTGSNGSEDLQEELMEEFVENSEIAWILTNYGYSPHRMANLKNFSLLENPIPDVCADRLDYSLRQFNRDLELGLAEKTLSSITSHNGEIVFVDTEGARVFAENFLKLQIEAWASEEAVIRYYLFSEVLKNAIEEGLVSKEDFYKDDEHIMNVLNNSGNNVVIANLEMLARPYQNITYQKTGSKVHKKFRFVDPKILVDSNIARLSEIDDVFASHIKTEKNKSDEGIEI